MKPINAPFKNPSGLHIIYVINPINSKITEWKHFFRIMSMKWILNSPDIKLPVFIGS